MRGACYCLALSVLGNPARVLAAVLGHAVLELQSEVVLLEIRSTKGSVKKVEASESFSPRVIRGEGGKCTACRSSSQRTSKMHSFMREIKSMCTV